MSKRYTTCTTKGRPSTAVDVGVRRASLRGVTVAANGELWFAENFANKVGHMTPNGEMLGEHDIPYAGSGPRCIMTHSSGRMFFGAFDIGAICEIVIAS